MSKPIDGSLDSWAVSQLESFEQAWVSGAHPSILDWTAKIDACLRDKSMRHQLVTELALIDMEFRWRQQGGQKTRTSGWYRVALEIEDDAVVELAEHEMRVRSCWGDGPTIDQVVSDLPQPERVVKNLHRFLQRRFPLRAVIAKSLGDPLVEVPVLSETVIGRQRSGEPAPISFLETEAADATSRCRVVIADDRDSSVSRRQLVLYRRSMETVGAEPASRGKEVRLNGDPITPGKASVVGLADKLSIGSLQLTLVSRW